MSLSTNHIPTVQPTVLTIGPPGINNIYVRPKRPQNIFQPAPHQQLTAMNNINNINNISNISNMLPNNISNVNLTTINNQQMATGAPRMRHQQNNQRPPPGTVNLERSYQICQAVIQSSTNPNREKLNNQLKPPPPPLLGHKKF